MSFVVSSAVAQERELNPYQALQVPQPLLSQSVSTTSKLHDLSIADSSTIHALVKEAESLALQPEHRAPVAGETSSPTTQQPPAFDFGTFATLVGDAIAKLSRYETLDECKRDFYRLVNHFGGMSRLRYISNPGFNRIWDYPVSAGDCYASLFMEKYGETPIGEEEHLNFFCVTQESTCHQVHQWIRESIYDPDD